MILDKNKINDILNRMNNNEKISIIERRIFFSNYKNIRNANLTYSLSNDEMMEWFKCKYSIEYFIETFLEIELRNYQKQIIKNFEENNYNIWFCSRDMNSVTTRSAIYLHHIIFNKNQNVSIYSNHSCHSLEVINEIKKLYKQLPFFIKPGVNNWTQKKISFDNGCKIFTMNSHDEKNIKIDIDVMDLNITYNRGIMLENSYNNFIIPLLSNKKLKLFMFGRPKDKFFSDMIKNADAKENNYTILRTFWWEISIRDENWKKEKRKLIGGEENFRKEYELSME
jgi:hypothetical protein